MQIDMSHRIEAGMTVYPGDPSVSVEPHATHARDGCRVRVAQLGSHTGTHIDAPAHVMAEGRTLDTYSLDRFTFDAVRVDCTDMADREPITAADVPDEAADMVVFWTGWDSYWGTDRYLEHPYLTAGGAAACAERGYAVGVDTLSPDPTSTDSTAEGESSGLQAHRALLGADNLIIENLCNLERTPERFELRAYPVALGGDGAPVRAVGVVK